MNKFSLPFIGPIDLAHSTWHETVITINNRKVSIDADFQLEEMEQHQVDMIHQLFKNIAKYDDDNINHIHADYHNPACDTVALYIQLHLEDGGKETLNHLINFSDPSVSPEQQFLANIHLTRVGIYVDYEQYFFIFDYTIDNTITDHVIVINLDAKGQLDHITIES